MPRNDNPGGRPRKYANDAERQKAYRERWANITVRTEAETKATLERLAEFSDEPISEVVNSLIKYALLNRNWFTVGLFGKRLPRVTDQQYLEKIAAARRKREESENE